MDKERAVDKLLRQGPLSAGVRSPARTAAHKSGMKDAMIDAKPIRATDAQLSGLPPRMRRAYECVYTLTQMQMASPFLFPVKDMYDSSAIPGYFKDIKRPMDLNTILTNIVATRYPSEDTVRSDVNLVFDNACLYLGSNHPMYQNAKACMGEVDSLWKTLDSVSTRSRHQVDRWGTRHGESTVDEGPPSRRQPPSASPGTGPPPRRAR